MPIQVVSARKSSFKPGERDSPFGSFILRASDDGMGSGAVRMRSFAPSSAFLTSFEPRRGPESFLDAMEAEQSPDRGATSMRRAPREARRPRQLASTEYLVLFLTTTPAGSSVAKPSYSAAEVSARET